jgi:hypothetical protein
MTGPPTVPVTRDQAIMMIEQADDLNSLTRDQVAAIRVLFRLDDPRPLAEIHSGGCSCACSSDPGYVCPCGENCTAREQEERPGEGEEAI